MSSGTRQPVPAHQQDRQQRIDARLRQLETEAEATRLPRQGSARLPPARPVSALPRTSSNLSSSSNRSSGSVSSRPRQVTVRDGPQPMSNSERRRMTPTSSPQALPRVPSQGQMRAGPPPQQSPAQPRPQQSLPRVPSQGNMQRPMAPMPPQSARSPSTQPAYRPPSALDGYGGPAPRPPSALAGYQPRPTRTMSALGGGGYGAPAARPPSSLAGYQPYPDRPISAMGSGYDAPRPRPPSAMGGYQPTYPDRPMSALDGYGGPAPRSPSAMGGGYQPNPDRPMSALGTYPSFSQQPRDMSTLGGSFSGYPGAAAGAPMPGMQGPGGLYSTGSFCGRPVTPFGGMMPGSANPLIDPNLSFSMSSLNSSMYGGMPIGMMPNASMYAMMMPQTSFMRTDSFANKPVLLHRSGSFGKITMDPIADASVLGANTPRSPTKTKYVVINNDPTRPGRSVVTVVKADNDQQIVELARKGSFSRPSGAGFASDSVMGGEHSNTVRPPPPAGAAAGSTTSPQPASGSSRLPGRVSFDPVAIRPNPPPSTAAATRPTSGSLQPPTSSPSSSKPRPSAPSAGAPRPPSTARTSSGYPARMFKDAAASRNKALAVAAVSRRGR